MTILHSGLFCSVSIKPVSTSDSAETQKDIQIRLQDADPGEFNVAVGFGTVEKFRISSEISYKNIFGNAYQVRLCDKSSTIEKKLNLLLPILGYLDHPVVLSINELVLLLKKVIFSDAC